MSVSYRLKIASNMGLSLQHSISSAFWITFLRITGVTGFRTHLNGPGWLHHMILNHDCEDSSLKQESYIPCFLLSSSLGFWPILSAHAVKSFNPWLGSFSTLSCFFDGLRSGDVSMWSETRSAHRITWMLTGHMLDWISKRQGRMVWREAVVLKAVAQISKQHPKESSQQHEQNENYPGKVSWETERSTWRGWEGVKPGD